MRSVYFLLLTLIMGCSSDLDIIYNQPSVPVIYAVINPLDTIHFIRVQKTFIINTKNDWSNLNSDSLQYHDVEVFLYGKTGDSIMWVEQFSKISMIKEDGFFPAGNYQSFQLDHPLPINFYNPNRYYYGKPDIDSLILEVVISDNDMITRSSAKVLDAGKIIAYRSPKYIYAYGDKPSVFGMPSTGESSGEVFTVSYQQIEFCVHFKQYYENYHSIEKISWMTNSGWDGNLYFITPGKLFNRMRPLLSNSDSILSRRLDSIDITIIKPSRFFNDYWYIREYWENSDRPPYSNFDNSYGMFITIAKDKLTGLRLDSQSLDSLCNSINYRDMKFKNW